jgi:hypothetical protein
MQVSLRFSHPCQQDKSILGSMGWNPFHNFTRASLDKRIRFDASEINIQRLLGWLTFDPMEVEGANFFCAYGFATLREGKVGSSLFFRSTINWNICERNRRRLWFLPFNRYNEMSSRLDLAEHHSRTRHQHRIYPSVRCYQDTIDHNSECFRSQHEQV